MKSATQMVSEVSLEEVLLLAQQLRPVDQARLVVRLAPKVEQFLSQVDEEGTSQARQPLRGLLSDLGSAPSTEDIDEVQQEMWSILGQG